MSSHLRVPNCRAYKKTYCWLPRARSSEFCATCAQAKQRDDLKRVIEDLPTSSLTAEQIFAILVKPDVCFGIQAAPQSSTLDQLLYSLWVRGRHAQPLLHRYIEHIQKTPVKASLLLRVRNHSRTNLCSVYRWMLRKGLFPDTMLPQSCLKCLGATAVYGCDNAAKVAELRRWIFHPNTPLTPLLRQTLTLTDSLERLVNFVQDLLDSPSDQLSDIWLMALRSIISIVQPTHPTYPNRLRDLVRKHPVCLAEAFQPASFATYGNDAKQTVKDRLAPFEEELLAKSWHPCRFQHWVWDEVERHDYGVQEIGPPPLLRRGERADWNIRW